MNAKAIKVLEFDKIKKQLAQKVSSDLGKEAVEELKLYKTKDEIERRLMEVKEAREITVAKGEIPLGPIYQMHTIIKKSNVGSCLSIEEIIQVLDTIRTARLLKKFIIKIEASEERYPLLNLIIDKIETFQYLEKKINKTIENASEISDHASSKLAHIRSSMRTTNSRIRSKLESIIHSSQTQKYLQDALITVRNNRFVVPVKSSYKNKIKGIVHDRSSSGVTLYIEPNAVVKMNNKLKELKADEEKEIQRILYEITDMVAEITYGLENNQLLLKQIDLILAKTDLANEMEAIIPKINKERYFRIVKGRHPLISKDEVVPLDIWLGQDFSSLVITGPNTGGKTVTLKTVGLLTLMTMAGMHIPAGIGTEICIFDQVYADIGDEQSIEQSLSTFSSHMTNIVKILKNADQNSLVLFDELGAGTDPTEGAALATSILEYLFEKDIRVIATTHYNELKEYALVNDNIENASVDFDVETLSPTYHLSIGIPGRSNAFEISQKLGLMSQIIDDAKRFVKKENVKFEEIISSIEEDRKVSEEERDEAINLRIQVEKLKEELDQEREKIRETKKNIIRESKREARRVLKQAKREAKEIIKDLRNIEEVSKENNKKVESLRNTLNKKISDHQDSIFDEEQTHETPEELKEGDKVKIMTLGQTGDVVSIDGDDVLVQAGIMKVNVKIDDLKRVKGSVKKTPQPKMQRNKKFRKKAKNVKAEIDIRGKNVDEATYILDDYLDEVYLSSLETITIIHGKGTGALRQGIRSYLETHYHVQDFREGQRGEGGSGVTIVTVK